MKSTEEIEKEVLRDVKNTIGYHESENKKEFISGADAAINKIMPLIKRLEGNIKYGDEELDIINKKIDVFKEAFSDLLGIDL